MNKNVKHTRASEGPPSLDEPSGLDEGTEPSWVTNFMEIEEIEDVEELDVLMAREHKPNPIADHNTSLNTIHKRSAHMSQQLETIINDLSQISGFIAAAIVNAESGMSLATKTVDASFDIEVAAAANTEVVRAKNSAMQALQLGDARIEDILITLTTQYHLIRPSANNPMLFIYLALDRKKSNLALARHSLAAAESKLDL